MKKTVGIIIALGLAMGLVMLLLPSPKSSTSSQAITANVGQYLPPDTMLVVTASNIKTMITEIPKSPIGRLFGKETVHALMKEMQASSRDIAEYNKMHASINNFLNNSSFSLLFGDSFTFAILPINMDKMVEEIEVAEETGSREEGAILKYFVAITTTTSPATLNAFSSLMDRIKVSQEQINDLPMLKITLANERINGYAYIDGNNVLLALHPDGITACLANKKGAPLAAADGFADIERMWSAYPDERTYFRYLVNMGSINSMITEIKNPQIKRFLEEEEMRQAIDLYQGLGYMFGVTYTTPSTLESQYRLSYDPARLNPTMKRLLSEKAEQNPYLFLLAKQPLMYGWATPLDLRYITDLFASDRYMLEVMEEGSKEVLGLTLDELCRSMGPQYGLTMDSIVNSGLFPIPKMSFWIQVRDNALVEKGIAHMVAQSQESGPAPVQVKVGDASFYSWPLMPGDAGQPAVAVHNNTLYVTTSTQGMKDILSNTAPATQMPEATTAKLGKELGQQIAKANSSVAIIYPARFTEPVLGLIDFINNYSYSSNSTVPSHTLKKELGAFLNSMDYLAGYCNTVPGQVDCTSILKWADAPAEQGQ